MAVDPKAPNGKTFKEFLAANLDGLVEMAKKEGAREQELSIIRSLPAVADECPVQGLTEEEWGSQVLQAVTNARNEPKLPKPPGSATIEIEDEGKWVVSNLDGVVKPPHDLEACRHVCQKALRFHSDFNPAEYRIRVGEDTFSPLPEAENEFEGQIEKEEILS